MKPIPLLYGFVLLTLISQAASAQESAPWDKDAAQKEIDGMRRYAWALSGAIGKTLEDSPAEQYPAVHAFMKDFRAAREGIDTQKPPSEWKVIDMDKLAIRNPNYWAAVYEVEPADPLMMWFHSTLYAVNGSVHRTLYNQQIAVHSASGSKWQGKMARLLISSARLIKLGTEGVKAGTTLHDKKKYGNAEKVYRDVLATIPSHSLALYELGYTLRTRERDENKENSHLDQPYFDRAKKCDPFMLTAYQGNFKRDAWKQYQALRAKAKPSWDTFSKTAPGTADVKQLENLSSHFQAAGLHDLALLTRQLAVAHRDRIYTDEDRQFIAANLKALIPDGDFAATLEGLSQQKPRLQIENLTLEK